MSALTRRGIRGLLLDLFDLLDPLDALHLWFGGLAMRIEGGIQNGRYMIGLKPDQEADHSGRNIPIRLVQHIKPT
jgi:hypothetical protein